MNPATMYPSVISPIGQTSDAMAAIFRWSPPGQSSSSPCRRLTVSSLGANPLAGGSSFQAPSAGSSSRTPKANLCCRPSGDAAHALVIWSALGAVTKRIRLVVGSPLRNHGRQKHASIINQWAHVGITAANPEFVIPPEGTNLPQIQIDMSDRPFRRGVHSGVQCVAFGLNCGSGPRWIPRRNISDSAENRARCTVRLLSGRPAKYSGSSWLTATHPPPALIALRASSGLVKSSRKCCLPL